MEQIKVDPQNQIVISNAIITLQIKFKLKIDFYFQNL